MALRAARTTPARPLHRHLRLLPRREPLGFAAVLVPLLDPDAAAAVTTAACRLARDSHAVVTALAVVSVPAELPLDALMEDEEEEARESLREARAQADQYGVTIVTRLRRARDVADAVVEEAAETGADLILLRVPRRSATRRGPVFGPSVAGLLKRAPCRVLVSAPRPAP